MAINHGETRSLRYDKSVDTFEDNFKLAARKGTIVSLGNASGVAPPFSPLKLGEKNLKFARPRSDLASFTDLVNVSDNNTQTVRICPYPPRTAYLYC